MDENRLIALQLASLNSRPEVMLILEDEAAAAEERKDES